jgi:quercetin dioxygenase-like cupin family protein
VGAFSDLRTLPPQRIWDGVAGRTVHGDRVTFTLVELDAGVVVPEHSHENEQVGMLLSGSLVFTIGGETRELRVGEAWCIAGDVPHSVVAGPAGAVVIEVFSPVRDDWSALETDEPRPARWPSA